MARAKRLGQQEQADPGNPVLRAADEHNAAQRLGARALGTAQDFFPEPASVRESRNSSSGSQSIHLAERSEGMVFPGEPLALLCGSGLPHQSSREPAAAPHDDPRFCASCLKARPGAATPVVAVLVTAK